MDERLENPERILIVDDEEGLLTLVKITLNKEQYHNITCVSTGTEALECIKNNQYDLIILDVMLPDYCGFDLCTKIRRQTIAPIIFLTARAGDYDKLSGLAIGGDDYITKPFNTMELVARIKAIFRRQQLEREVLNTHSESVMIYSYGYIVLDMARAILTVNNQAVECTAKELELMEFFCQNPNKVFTTSHLYDTIWGLPGYGDEKTVTIHISKLRKKILDDNKPYKVITNLRGIGYKFIPPDGS
ncbi:response regulator transcription factor [Clostridioides difficile]|nr:response regulator transcription factor [Clostridioides difficile]